MPYTGYYCPDGRERYLRAFQGAVFVVPGVPDAAIFGPRGLPGPLVGGAVAVVMSAAVVRVRLPVAGDVKRRAGRRGRQALFADFQLLEVGVDRRFGDALDRRGSSLREKKKESNWLCIRFWKLNEVSAVKLIQNV